MGNYINTFQFWEPRTKLVTGTIFIFGTISLNNISLLLAALFFSIFFTLCSGLSWKKLIKKLSVVIPFLALMSLPLIFGSGLSPSIDRVEFAAKISLKAFTAMTFTLFIFANQPIEEMLEALEHLKVPSAITTIIYLAYRYGFLFIKEMQTSLWALKSRLFTARLDRYSLKIFGELTGGIFIKAINHSETVYQAMSARGFHGNILINVPQPVKINDIFKSLLPIGFILFLMIVDKVVF
ncbi:cobalt ECF transporter T component CbiQ [Natranaerobius trueperi]|uniref:Cobalt ECF transporter T component CbiQ n=1 Tax=Natranaerobius trueperi TaxID=759412 RepID=A0A226C0E8_9FIRM|nr:cobalt ECF transporter T component CbiQ [Natranaerobius trueperi]OWZ83847.1 cobalt ECF transporter T component CbiQ [Natranaerobius trueperi]